jgi:hydroxyacylglutathione hydrolase
MVTCRRPQQKPDPAYGAGSLCGRQISSAQFTTIGQEAATNWALQFTDRDRFVEAMVTNLPDRPSYFNRSVTINLRGAPFLSDCPKLGHLEPAEFNVLKQQGATTLDVRPPALFGDAHAASTRRRNFAKCACDGRMREWIPQFDRSEPP